MHGIETRCMYLGTLHDSRSKLRLVCDTHDIMSSATLSTTRSRPTHHSLLQLYTGRRRGQVRRSESREKRSLLGLLEGAGSRLGGRAPSRPTTGGEATWHPISRDGMAVDDSQFRQFATPELDFGKGRRLSPNTTGLGEIPNAHTGGALSSASPGSKRSRG